MPMMAWAAPGWPANGALTPVVSPDVARLTLRAEAETSVLDPQGMRRLWVPALVLVVNVVLVVLWLIALVQLVTGDRGPPSWWLPVWVLALPLSTGGTFLSTTVMRARPDAGVMPRLGRQRWRWYRQLWREPVAAPAPPAVWPPGSEAHAVLSGAASVRSVALSWLCERVGMSTTVGAQWVTVLARQGWLTGGGHLLGFARLPEVHVVATDAGRERLERERARLQRLAAS